MALSAVQNVNFKGNDCPTCQKKTGGAVPLLASLAIPGLGQYIDGRKPQAKKFFLTNLAAAAVAGVGAGIATATANLASMAKTKGGKVGAIAATAVAAGFAVAGMVKGAVNRVQDLKDAYQGDRNVDTQA